jgi:ubiquinone/menaquinone biosynthesis C-methylase UbiE
MNNKFEKVGADLASHYDKLVKKFGDDVKSSQQSTKASRKKRLEILLKYIDFKKGNSILDFGCGTGYLYKYLQKSGFKVKYTGIDISSEAIKFAKKIYNKENNCNFILANILERNLKKKFDHILINGTFNNNTKNNWNWMRESLIRLYSITKKTLVFNNLSNYVDYYDKKLFYAQPEKVFNFCKKKLGHKVIIDNSYVLKKNIVPYEFTTCIKR